MTRLRATPRSVLLLGLRQVGKSTLLGLMKPDLVLNLVDPEVHRRYLAHPELLFHYGTKAVARAITKDAVIMTASDNPSWRRPNRSACPGRRPNGSLYGLSRYVRSMIAAMSGPFQYGLIQRKRWSLQLFGARRQCPRTMNLLRMARPAGSRSSAW